MLGARLARWISLNEPHYVTSSTAWTNAAERFRPISQSDLEPMVEGTGLDPHFLLSNSYATTWFPEFAWDGYAMVPPYVGARCVVHRCVVHSAMLS